MPAKKKPTPGRIAFVAVGPGDPDLLTLRAADLLCRAAVIVADPAAVTAVQAHLTSEVRVVEAIDDAGQPLAAAGASRIVIDEARSGLDVVRLLSGDPVLDGSLAVEIAAVTKAHLSYEVAPGVSAIAASAAYSGLSLTGGTARDIHVVDFDAPGLDYADHVDADLTLVVLNAGDHVGDLAKGLLANGRPENTPVLVVSDATTVDQRSIAAPLGEIAAAVKSAKHVGPALVIVGDVARARVAAGASWFERRPLLGWRVLVPRTKDDVGPVDRMLAQLGALSTQVPTISVEPPRTPQQMERAIHGLVSGRYEWIAFTSANAVKAVKERFEEYGLDSRSFAGLKIAAVGEQTVAALKALGLRPDLVPSGDQTTAALLEEWPVYDELIDPINRVFLPRADIATETLSEGLTSLGWEVDDVTAYRTVRAAPPAAHIRDAIKAGGFDAVLFTSSSTVRNLVGIAGKPHQTTVVACIGPQTAKTAEEHGLRVDVLADEATVESLVTAMAAHGESLRIAALEGGEASWRPSRRRVGARRKA
jgi:uroporphyrinogen III methyltransferase / synthase